MSRCNLPNLKILKLALLSVDKKQVIGYTISKSLGLAQTIDKSKGLRKMTDWKPDENSQMEKELRDFGYSLFSDLYHWEWHPNTENSLLVSLRFNSPEQATNYAHRMLELGKLQPVNF